MRAHSTTKTSSFYLADGQQPHLLGDTNITLPSDATPAAYDERLKRIQLARIQAARVTYEQAFKNKQWRDGIVKPHHLNIGTWVLVRHKSPNKFEAKRDCLYQILDKMLLHTYRLQDPKGQELPTLMHGNHLVDTKINNTEDTWRLSNVDHDDVTFAAGSRYEIMN